jgi:hypothetical protein
MRAIGAIDLDSIIIHFPKAGRRWFDRRLALLNQ